MEFEYLERRFVLFELVNPFMEETSDIIQVMEIVDNIETGLEEYKFINYFYGATIMDEEKAIEIAKRYIDMEGE